MERVVFAIDLNTVVLVIEVCFVDRRGPNYCTGAVVLKSGFEMSQPLHLTYLSQIDSFGSTRGLCGVSSQDIDIVTVVVWCCSERAIVCW